MTERHSKLYLHESDVEVLLTPELAIRAVREALRCHAAGAFDQPLKPYLRPVGRKREQVGGRFIAMPAYLGGPFHIAGVKWIAGFQANIDKGLPRASGVLILNSADTGVPLAVMDCAILSARRTAAVVTISVDLLGPTRRRNIAILGAGPIAQATIESLVSRPREIDSICVYDLRYDRASELAAYFSRLTAVSIRVATDVRSCVSGAAIVVTATTAKSSYLRREWLRQCRLLVALSFEDCDEEVLLSANKLIVDDFEQCNREEKLIHRLVRDGRLSRDHVYAELGQIVSGRLPGREHADEFIYVNPMGMAIEDIAVASQVYSAALDAGRGSQIP